MEAKKRKEVEAVEREVIHAFIQEEIHDDVEELFNGFSGYIDPYEICLQEFESEINVTPHEKRGELIKPVLEINSRRRMRLS